MTENKVPSPDSAPIEIRPLTVEDAEAVYQILLKSGSTPGVPAWSYKAVEDSLRQYSAIGAEDEAGVAAFILFRDLPGSREILHLASAERIRRRGWMNQLLAELIWDLGETTELWLEVHELNLAARRLYEKTGFTIVGERPRYYADGGTAVLYSLSARSL